MKRLPYLLLALAALLILGLLSSIVTHGFEELARAEEERSALEERKIELTESIEELEATLEAVRTDRRPGLGRAGGRRKLRRVGRGGMIPGSPAGGSPAGPRSPPRPSG